MSVAIERKRGQQRSGAPKPRRTPWLDWLVVPTVVILIVVVAYPVVRAVMLSFSEYSLITGDAGSRPVGLDNYAQIVKDPIFWQAVRNTVYFAVASLIGGGLVGLALALATENLGGKWRFVRGALLTPWAIPVIVAAFLFQYLFLDRGGIINDALMTTGIIDQPIPWLTSGDYALTATIIANIWQTAPFFLLVFTAALRSVPNEVIEAARIDKSGPWTLIWRIKLPYLAAPGVIAAVIMTVQNVNQFPLIWAMTQGGPGYSTTTLTIYLYRLVFVSYNVGYASAIGVVWLVIMLLVTAVFLKRRKAGAR